MSRRNRPVNLGGLGPKQQKSVVCNACQADDCPNCLDVVRVALGQPEQCPCKRKGHTGEIGDRHPDDPVADRLATQYMEKQFDDPTR